MGATKKLLYHASKDSAKLAVDFVHLRAALHCDKEPCVLIMKRLRTQIKDRPIDAPTLPQIVGAHHVPRGDLVGVQSQSIRITPCRRLAV